MKTTRFEKTGLLAVNPQAFLELFMEEPPKRDVRQAGSFPVIEIMGPLVHHACGMFDSYDEIHDRFAKACAAPGDVVILKVDSPGGEVHGCFDTARELRAIAAAAGKRIVAYVDGQACSAAYALACAADEIVVPPTGITGSIGVIDSRIDVTAQDAAFGLKFTFITSGERKADGNPHTAVSDAELASRQSAVDAIAGIFFELVAERRGVAAEAIESLQARCLIGAESVKAGLANRVQSFDEMLAALAARPSTEDTQMSKYSEARAALEEAAKGDDEEAKRAKRALAAMDDDGEPDGDEKNAEGEESDDDKKKKDEEAARAAAAASSALSAQAPTQDLTEIQEELRASFLATRPDLTKDQLAAVAGLPLKQLRAVVNAIPKPAKPVHTPAPAPTRADGQDGNGEGPRLPADAKAALDVRMGLKAVASIGVEKTPHKLTLGVPVVVAGKVG